jgi:acyl-homoserine-lactone acylase
VAAGVDALSDTSVLPDAARSEYQYLTDVGGTHIPLAGGCADQGYFTIVCTSMSRRGVKIGDHGNSYMQVVGFTDDGVEPYTLFVPSQSTDPASPHYRDYTRAYSQKSWLRAPFTDDEVKADAKSTVELEE